MIVIDLREPIAPFVACQPFHQPLERMRACHNSCSRRGIVGHCPSLGCDVV